MRQTAANSENHDARLLYIVDLASCRAHYLTPLMDARHDMVLADVKRNAADRSTLMRYESRFRYHDEVVSVFSNGICFKGGEVR